MQAVISNGGSSPDEQLLSREAINRVFVQQPSGINRVLMMPVRVDLSYALAGSTNCIGITSGNRCYWRGWGGPLVVNDLDKGITLTCMMNRVQAGVAENETSTAVTAALDSIVGTH